MSFGYGLATIVVRSVDVRCDAGHQREHLVL